MIISPNVMTQSPKDRLSFVILLIRFNHTLVVLPVCFIVSWNHCKLLLTYFISFTVTLTVFFFLFCWAIRFNLRFIDLQHNLLTLVLFFVNSIKLFLGNERWFYLRGWQNKPLLLLFPIGSSKMFLNTSLLSSEHCLHTLSWLDS